MILIERANMEVTSEDLFSVMDYKCIRLSERGYFSLVAYAEKKTGLTQEFWDRIACQDNPAVFERLTEPTDF